MKHSRHFLSVFCRISGVCGILAVVGLYLPLALPPLFDLEAFSITSASMAPQLPVGSLVFVREAEDPAVLEAGQIVAFRSGMEGPDGEDIITHRIVSNDQVRCELTTKGDANSVPDLRPVSYERLCGVVEGSIPFLGGPALFLGSAAGRLAAVLVLGGAGALYTAGIHFDNRK